MRITLEEASNRLKTGGVVAVPTETVYGLAASVDHPNAIRDVFALKGRPSDNPLITHIADITQIQPLVESLPPGFDSLTEAFWPGPLTLVVPVNEEKLHTLIRAGLPTAAFRMPSHPAAQKLIAMTGPLVMPSANVSSRPSSTAPEHVEEDFGKHFPVLAADEEACRLGLESTVLIYDGEAWTIGRLGAVTAEQLQTVLGYRPLVAKGPAKPTCPGQRYRHYAPRCTLDLVQEIPANASVVIGFDDRAYPAAARVFSMGLLSAPETAAHRLYTLLRTLDTENIAEAWVDIDFPDEGLWTSLRERLQKAAGLDN